MKKFNNQNPVINTVLISLGTGLSKVLGFVREMSIAFFFGASYVVDAYLVALMIPQVLFAVVGGALTTTIIPLVTEYKEREGMDSVLTLVNSVTSFMAAVLAVIILLGEVFALYVVKLLAPGFSGEVVQLTVSLSRIMFPAMMFMGLAGLGTGILQSQRRFLYPAFIGIPYNVLIIGSLFVSAKIWGITGLAVGTLLGIVSQWLFQVPDLRKTGCRFRIKVDFSHPGFRKMGKLILPVIIGAGAAQINVLVDRMLASGLVEGSIAALNYANKLNILALGVIAVAVANAMYPEFAEAHVLNDSRKFLNSVLRSFNGLLLIILPFSAGMIILREPLVRVVYQRGAFDDTAFALTVIALFFYTLGLPAMSLREIILRAFYSLQDTKTPMVIGVVTVVINIILNIILVRYLAHGGLALATSISVTAGLLMLLWYLRKKLGHIGGAVILKTGAKVGFSCLVMGAAVVFLYNRMQGVLGDGLVGDLAVICACAAAGAGVYFALIKFLKVEEFEWLVGKVCSRFRR